MQTKHADLDHYWESLDVALPTFTPEEQEAAIALYRELARGSAVTAERLGARLGVKASVARQLLERQSIKALAYLDEQGAVLGFGGLAAAPMPHEFELDGRTLWTWCAWDSLFIPEILGEVAQVKSKDPMSGAVIRLEVGPAGVRSSDPSGVVVSFVRPDAEQFNTSAANVMASFCHFVFFFESVDSGERWAANHPGTFVVTLDEAAELARRLNVRTWGDALDNGGATDRGP